MTPLFSPFTLRQVTIRNRIAMAPMCMFMADDDGMATDWHLAHLAARAMGGVGLIITEATAVQARGRISDRDLGLWNDKQVGPLRRIVRLCQEQGTVMCSQLAHAGRKAWSRNKGTGPLLPIAPSALAHDVGWVVPHELSHAEVDGLVLAFCEAASRAHAAGFGAIEIHAGHGYLLHQFLSPISNQRQDEYGGSLENRARLLLRIVRDVRRVIPQSHPLLVRLSCTDWVSGGLVLDDMIPLSQWLREAGVDLIDCSSAGISAVIPPATPGYQVRFAERIRRDADISTLAVGLITTAEQAEEIVENECADLVALGRELLRHPNWPLYAADALGVDFPWPLPYHRAKPEKGTGIRKG